MIDDLDRRQPLLDAGAGTPALTTVALVIAQPALLMMVQEVLRQCRGVDLRLTTPRVTDLVALPGRAWLRLVVCEPMVAREVRGLLHPEQRVVVLANAANTRAYPGSLVLDLDTPGWSDALVAVMRASRTDRPPPQERRRAVTTGQGLVGAWLRQQQVEAAAGPEQGLGSVAAYRQALSTLPRLDQPMALMVMGLQQVVQQMSETATVLRLLRSAIRMDDALFRLGDRTVAALIPSGDFAAVHGIITRLTWRLSPADPAALVAGCAVWRPGQAVEAAVGTARDQLLKALGPQPESQGLLQDLQGRETPLSTGARERAARVPSPATMDTAELRARLQVERQAGRHVGEQVVQPWVEAPPAYASEQALREATEAQEEEEFGHAGHGTGVARVAVGLAEAIGWSPDQTAQLRRAALLHDVGKIALDRALWGSPVPLKPWQRRLMEAHAGLGSELAETVGEDDTVVTAILHHHERWDGRGYPAHLAGDLIPLMARVLFVAEATDSMLRASYRRPPMAPERVAEVLEAEAGRLWDPDLARHAARMVRGRA